MKTPNATDEMRKTTNAVSTAVWLGEYVKAPETMDTTEWLKWMTSFIERIQQSSYADGYIDGGSQGYAEGAGLP